MAFSDFYTKRVSDIVQLEASISENKIFVILGQCDLIQEDYLNDNISDSNTFRITGGSFTYDRNWALQIFNTVNSYRSAHILSFAQYCYLTQFFSSEFFSDRVVILRDNLRQLLPISKNEFFEKTEEESIEQRPENLPIYQAEQIKIEDHYFYAAKLHLEEYRIINLFEKGDNLEISTNNDLDTIDISSDQYALDYFINMCISENNLQKYAQVKKYAKQPLSDSIENSIMVVNNVLRKFGGGLFIQTEEAIQEDYNPSETSRKLLRTYWGPHAEFRKMKVFRNPEVSNQITEISQGMVVDLIINEYGRAQKGLKPRDLFLTAPTGSGKSLLFQLPAFHVSNMGDITIVVSPLIALMKDQVNAIIKERGFEKIAYLNSELTLVDRERIIESSINGEIDVLYMSPEFLLSYHIQHFIGERNIGLLVVDEAHLITTWGRDFRVDYWFLGNHVRKIRKYDNLKFPMVAVTATAIYGGANDMVFDSIDSLVMHNPLIIIGQVKREEITFLVNNHSEFPTQYEKSKLEQTCDFIGKIASLGLKTLVYAPYTKHIKQITNKLNSQDHEIVVGYHGKMNPDEKELSYKLFRSGERKVMVSTKAFGMGVDISDIQVVYHHAPSGLLPDYIQEIGRVARDPSIQGFAALNYATQDQRFSKALHGMSAIRQYQLREVLKKIYNVYLKHKKSRNLLLSVDDFGYIFKDTLDLDQKVLTSLMMIEKDYLAKNHFNVLIARPKKLFVKVYARIPENDLRRFESRFEGMARIVESLGTGSVIIELNLDQLWYQDFPEMSFPILKYKFYSQKLLVNLGIQLIPQIKISVERLKDYNLILKGLRALFENISSTFSHFGRHYFTSEELITQIKTYVHDEVKATKLGDFITSSFSGRLLPTKGIEGNAFLARRRFTGSIKYSVFSTRYINDFSSILKIYGNLFMNHDQSISEKYITGGHLNTINYIRLGYFLEIMEWGIFEVRGGENPMVFVRINDPERILRDSKDNNYSNSLLAKTLERHTLSNQIFDHFFLRSFANEERWNFIEEYFLGNNVDSLLENFQGIEGNDLDIIDRLRSFKPTESTQIKHTPKENNIHIFQPKSDTWYKGEDLITLEDVDEMKTRRVNQWLSSNPVLFHKKQKEFGFKLDRSVYKILMSKLRAHYPEYYRDTMRLNLKIEFPGYSGLVNANIPYTDKPVKFYKWWLDNIDKIKMNISERIKLFDRVYQLNPEELKVKHRKQIGK